MSNAQLPTSVPTRLTQPYSLVVLGIGTWELCVEVARGYHHGAIQFSSVSNALETTEDRLLAEVATGTSADPFAILGRHPVTIDHRPAVILRTLQPQAARVEVVTADSVTPMPKRHPDGLFEARMPLDGSPDALVYRYRVH